MFKSSYSSRCKKNLKPADFNQSSKALAQEIIKRQTLSDDQVLFDTTPDVDNRPEDPSDRTKRMDEITQVAEEETQEESYMSKLLADTQEESPIEQSDSQSQQISSNASDPELEKATPVQEQVNQLPPYIKTQSLKENWLKDLPPDLSDLPNLDVIGPETQDAVRSIERHKPRFRLMESVPDSPELNETLKDSRSDTTLDGSETTTTSISVIDKPKTPVAQSTPIANQKTQVLHQSLPEKVVEIQEEEPWYHDPFENLERIYQRRSDPPNVEKDQSQKRERRVDEEGYSDLSEGSGNSSREMPPPDSELTLAIKNQKQLKSQVSKNSIREIESLVPKILPLTTVSSGSPVNLSRIFEPTSNQVKDSSSNVSDKFKSLDIYQNGSLGNEYDSQSSYIIPPTQLNEPMADPVSDCSDSTPNGFIVESPHMTQSNDPEPRNLNQTILNRSPGREKSCDILQIHTPTSTNIDNQINETNPGNLNHRDQIQIAEEEQSFDIPPTQVIFPTSDSAPENPFPISKAVPIPKEAQKNSCVTNLQVLNGCVVEEFSNGKITYSEEQGLRVECNLGKKKQQSDSSAIVTEFLNSDTTSNQFVANVDQHRSESEISHGSESRKRKSPEHEHVTDQPEPNQTEMFIEPQPRENLTAPSIELVGSTPKKTSEGVPAQKKRRLNSSEALEFPKEPQTARTSSVSRASISPRKKAAPRIVATHLARTRRLNRTLSNPSEQIFPIDRVFAYNLESKAFAFAQVNSLTHDQALVEFCYGYQQKCYLKQLRMCEIRAGDLVRYIGSELSEHESLLTDVRAPKKVLGLKPRRQRDITDVENDPNDSSSLTESEIFKIDDREDCLYCCSESDYSDYKPIFDEALKEARLNSCSIDETRIPDVSKFKVEAILLLPEKKKRRVDEEAFKDRLLSDQILKKFLDLMKFQSGVGMKNNYSTSGIKAINRNSIEYREKMMFEGFGILITTLSEIRINLSSSQSFINSSIASNNSNRANSKTGTKESSSTGTRADLERLIKERSGVIIDKLTEIFKITSKTEYSSSSLNPRPSDCSSNPDEQVRIIIPSSKNSIINRRNVEKKKNGKIASIRGDQRKSFSRTETEFRLEALGERSGNVDPRDYEELDCILILAEEPHMTQKYLISIGIGIPCVSIQWAIDCYQKGTRLDWRDYMIGTGSSDYLNGCQPLNNLQSKILLLRSSSYSLSSSNRRIGTTERNGKSEGQSDFGEEIENVEEGWDSFNVSSILKYQSKLQIFKNKKFIALYLIKNKKTSEWEDLIRSILGVLGVSKVLFKGIACDSIKVLKKTTSRKDKVGVKRNLEEEAVEEEEELEITGFDQLDEDDDENNSEEEEELESMVKKLLIEFDYLLVEDEILKLLSGLSILKKACSNNSNKRKRLDQNNILDDQKRTKSHAFFSSNLSSNMLYESLVDCKELIRGLISCETFEGLCKKLRKNHQIQQEQRQEQQRKVKDTKKKVGNRKVKKIVSNDDDGVEEDVVIGIGRNDKGKGIRRPGEESRVRDVYQSADQAIISTSRTTSLNSGRANDVGCDGRVEIVDFDWIKQCLIFGKILK